MPAPFSNIVLTSTDLLRDINATFLSTYAKVVGRNTKLNGCMRLGLGSNKRTERYGYYESPPTVDRVNKGEALSEEGLRAIAYSVTNLTWGKAIGYDEDDLDDVQLGDLRTVARNLAKRSAQIPEEVFFQIVNGTASARLLETIPVAPDGATLHAATAGGVARFGFTGGNIQTGSGIASSGAVRSDFWASMTRARQFQDTEGQPLLADDDLDGPVTVVYGAANEEVFAEAFIQGRTIQLGAAGNVSLVPEAAAAVTNTILESGRQITLWSTQRITNNHWYVFFNQVDPLPVFEQVRRAPRMMDETRDNSERARRYRVLATLLDMRSGYGINAAYGTVKVSN